MLLNHCTVWKGRGAKLLVLLPLLLCVLFFCNDVRAECLTWTDNSTPINYGSPPGVSNTSVGQNNGITGNLVSCVVSAILGDMDTLLVAMSNFLWPVVTAATVFAIAWQGINIMAGVGNLKTSIGFIFRVAAAAAFAYNLGGTYLDSGGNHKPFSHLPFLVMDELASDLSFNTYGCTGTGSPFYEIDCLLGKIFGFDSTGNGRQLFHGVLAMLGGSLFSGVAPGMMMFAAGLIALFEIVMFVLDIVYTYILAVLVLAIMVIVSPLMVPLILFKFSEKYFTKWLNTIIGAMLIPAFLFGFLNFSLILFNQVINDIGVGLNPSGYTDTAGFNYYAPYLRDNQNFFDWLTHMDPNQKKAAFAQSFTANSANPPTQVGPVQSNISPRAYDTPVFRMSTHWGINFGDQNEPNMVKVALSFVVLWIYSSIMMGMVQKMPELAQNIAGASLGISFTREPLGEKVNRAVQGAKTGGGMMLGAMAGNQIGKSITKSARGREASAIAGAIAGGLVGGRS